MKMDKYTPAQMQAIASTAQEILIVAGPGSGKTTTMVGFIKNLIENHCDPKRIVSLTFTNAAAKEFAHRLKAYELPPKGSPNYNIEFNEPIGYCGTLHGFALRCLKRYGDTIGYGQRMTVIGPDSARAILESKARSLGSKTSIDDLWDLKTAGRPRKDRDRPTVDQSVVASFYDDLREAGMVDFDIILQEFLALLTRWNQDLKPPADWTYQHLIVDEVQDSAAIDWDIFARLPMRYKAYVGDPDQAIYGFRGGRVDLMVTASVSPRFDPIVVLEQNFRSHSEICQAAQRLIENNARRVHKVTESAAGPGGGIYITQPAENEGHEIAMVANAIKSLLFHQEEPVEPSEVAVLARTNAIAYQFRRTLPHQGVPTKTIRMIPMPPDWPYVRALVELAADPMNDTLAFFALVQALQRSGMGEADANRRAHRLRRDAERAQKPLNWEIGLPAGLSLNNLLQCLTEKYKITKESSMQLAARARGLPGTPDILDLAMACSANEPDPETSGNGVEILTIHGAKGREWDVVFLVGFEDETIPGKRKDSDIEEERRLAYVAITRARKAVYISHTLSRVTAWEAIVQTTPSRFLKEIAP